MFWILKKCSVRVWTGFIMFMIGTSVRGEGGRSCEHSNEPSGSMKGREFLD
jgi:hypothetical protein